MTSAKQAFISYSRADAEYVARLRVHLKPLEKKYKFVVWDDARLQPGDRWKNEIKENLAKADVIILLISADFLASDFVMEFEYPDALRMATERGAKVVAVIAGPCLFDEFEVADFQAVNTPHETLQDLEENGAAQERVFMECARVVSRYLRDPLP
ncbi:toll/interleukin-1 receptor domain-containing protein [Longimicrobium sp.]|uniref:toll/interleukin-1 receptor domain-containing protein n=1 Tax=Longimicrobium sp. TaxID=2029185 RepID=UPI003B3B5E9D